MSNLTKYLRYLGALVALLFVFGSGWFIRDIRARSEVEALLQDREIELQEIAVTRTQNSSLSKELANAGTERDILLDEIASLRSKPSEIKYITKVETIIVGEPTFLTTELPESHTFRTEVGLPVAKFTIEGENDAPEYAFDTADLAVTADLIIAERDNALSLRIESNLEPGVQYEIPVTKFNVTHIRETRTFEPHVLLGGSASIAPGISDVAPHLGISLFHPKTDWDLLHLRIGITGGSPSIGLDPVLYNVGGPLPILTNMWVAAGATINMQAQVAGTISLGAKL